MKRQIEAEGTPTANRLAQETIELLEKDYTELVEIARTSTTNKL